MVSYFFALNVQPVSARVDGAIVPVQRADGRLHAIEVPAGSRVVTFRLDAGG